MFKSETKLIVRYAETDQMGVVHHSNYPIWFEAGRTEYMKQLGFPYSKMEDMGVMLPLIELQCSYKGAARYGDEIIVVTSLKALSLTRITLAYEVLKNDDPNIITYGETIHVWTNKNLRPINIKKHAPDILSLFEKTLRSI